MRINPGHCGKIGIEKMIDSKSDKERTMIKRGSRFVSRLALVSVLFTLLPAAGFSEDLDQKIKRLEQTIARLELRIEKLEGIVLVVQKEQAKPAPAAANKWKEKASWRLLKKGMSKGEVERILGEPPKIVPNAYYGDIWLYPDLQGGNASFDKDGNLTSWKVF